MNFTIEKMKDSDWPVIKFIYQEGIDTGDATFEIEAPDWEKWNEGHLSECRLVVRAGNEIVGWAALSPVSGRCVYSGVAEVSLYIKSTARNQGIGKALLEAVVQESERIGIWTLQGGTFPENAASLAIQKACGFREVGVREKVGCMNGKWRDVILTERRSKIVGI
jgi:L-amino acid N-acyltransferase YncA